MDQGLQRIGHGRRTGSRGQCCHAPLQCRQPALQHILRRIGEASVYIACILQSEAVRRMI